MTHRNSFYIIQFGISVMATSVNAGVKVLPVLNQPIADRSGLSGFPLTVNLNAAFGTEPIDDQVVRFKSQFNDGGVPVVMDMALFSNRTPVTRTNFLKYVTDGDYVNSFIHRSVPGFVIQGGGFRITSGSIGSVPTDPAIVNEFGVSNTLGTVSMAKLGGNADSATSQWFVSLGANSDNLDNQNGGFTVFGRVTRSTFGNAQIFGDPSVFPIFNYGGSFTELPLFNTHTSAGLYPSEFILFPAVSLEPLPAGEAGENTVLSYSVVSNSNASLATVGVLPGGTLELSPQPGQTGFSTIKIRATDSVGNTVDDSFILTVNAADTYQTWASRSACPAGQTDLALNPDGDALINLLEYAFLEDPAVATQGTPPLIESTGSPSGQQFMSLTFPVRKFTVGLDYFVEGGDSLAGPWTTVWSSTDGFAHTQVVDAVDQPDRTVVTVKDSVAIGGRRQRFLRTRVVQE